MLSNLEIYDAIHALAKEEGYEFSDEELESVAGGAYIYCEVKQCGSF